jgi:molybdopterin synthase sulfur carrier subunit
MRVRVKLFATLSRFSAGGLPGTPFEIELPQGACLLDLVKQLKIPPEEAHIAFVNGIIQPKEWGLAPGDEVGIFPPIGGG